MVITCGDSYDTILHGAFVESIYPGSPADLDGKVKPGMFLLVFIYFLFKKIYSWGK